MLVGMEDRRSTIPDALPKASSEPLAEISSFLEPFAPLFRRSQSRHSLERYVTGLLTDLSRKNCDTIAAAVAGTSTERLQHLLTDADWNSRELDGARVRSLSQQSPEGGILWWLTTLPFPSKAKILCWSRSPVLLWGSSGQAGQLSGGGKRPLRRRRARELAPFALLAC